MCLKISTICRNRKEYTIFAKCLHPSVRKFTAYYCHFQNNSYKMHWKYSLWFQILTFDLMWVVKNVLLDWISKKNNSHSVKNSLCKNVILHISKTTFLLVFEQQKKEYLFFLLLQIFEFVTVKISDKFHSNWGTNFHCSQLSFRTAHGLVLLKCVEVQVYHNFSFSMSDVGII